MVDAPISRVRLRDLARPGRSRPGGRPRSGLASGVRFATRPARAPEPAISWHRPSRLSAVTQWRLIGAMLVVVLAVWLVGAAVTKYTLEQMAYVTPIAIVVVGVTIGLVLLWVKVVADSLRRRGEH